MSRDLTSRFTDPSVIPRSEYNLPDEITLIAQYTYREKITPVRATDSHLPKKK